MHHILTICANMLNITQLVTGASRHCPVHYVAQYSAALRHGAALSAGRKLQSQ